MTILNNSLNKYRAINNVKLNFLLAVYFVLVLNLPLFYHLHGITNSLTTKLGFIISLPIFLFAILNLVFLPFSFWFIQKIFFIFLLLISSLASYSMLKYGIIFDYGMTQNIFETNQREAFEYINLRSISWFIITGVMPCILLLWCKIQYPSTIYKGLMIRMISLLISVGTIIIIASLYSKDYFSIGRNNRIIGHKIVPNIFFNSFKYVRNNYFRKDDIPFVHIVLMLKMLVKMH